MVLGNRLKAIADIIPKCRCVADIGTDHAYIPIYCIENRICETAFACDVKSGPLLTAQKNIERYGLADRIATRLSDGLENIKKGEADAFVIAGMGGVLIGGILEKGHDKINGKTTLVLQPMTAAEELRKYLYESGFDIEDEVLSREGEKLYNIMKVKKGRVSYGLTDIAVGRHLLGDPLFKTYITAKKNVNDKIIAGIEKSSGKKNLEYYKKMDEIYKGFLQM